MNDNGNGDGQTGERDASLDLILPAANEDRLVSFAIPGRNARGRLVRLGPVLDAILANHGYPPAAAQLLAEALTLTALLGATLKDEGAQLTIQAQAQGGAIDLLVCDWRAGAVRGYLKHDAERLAALPDGADLGLLFGEGYLAITFDQSASGERYQGIVPLAGASIAEAAESYFVQSEQLPSIVRLAVVDRGEAGHSAGGLLIQHLAEGEEGRERLHVRQDHPDWAHVAALAATVTTDELVDPALELEALLWRLFHEDEVRVQPTLSLSRGCRCSPHHIRDVLMRFPESERQAMRDDDGHIIVDCAFCARNFTVDL
jgi:molecular chaperone Hsp33